MAKGEASSQKPGYLCKGLQQCASVVRYCLSKIKAEAAAALLLRSGPDALILCTLIDDTFGNIELTDLSQTSVHQVSAGRSVFLAVPRRTAEARGFCVRALHGTVVHSVTAGMLAAILFGAHAAPCELTLEEDMVLEATVLDLLWLAVKASNRGEPGSGGAVESASSAARSAIEQNLETGKLSVSALCRQLQISRSTLHRLFRKEGGVQAYTRGRRLEAARRALEDSGNSEPIYLLAERLGFSDASHLNRLFRATYGVTPGTWRNFAASSRAVGNADRADS